MGVTIQSTGISVSNSKFLNGTAGTLINQGENNSISDSEIKDNRYNGTYLFSSSWNSLTNNDVIRNKYNGIRFDLSHNNSISGGDVSLSDISCVHLYSSENNSISQLNISSCLKGVYSEASWTNSYSSNNVSSNDYGIQLVSDSTNNTISHGNISNNFVGIAVNSSWQNRVNNNSILGNAFYGISAPSLLLADLDAEYNYFGTNDSTQITKLVTVNVDYSPWLSYRNSSVDYIDNYTEWTANRTLHNGVIVNSTGCLNISGSQQSPITIAFDNIHGQNFIQVNNATNINNAVLSGANGTYTLLYLDSTDGRIENSNLSRFLGIGIQSEEQRLSSDSGVTIHNNTFYLSSYGLILHRAKNTLVNKSTFLSNNHFGMYIHSSSKIDVGPNNTISNHHLGFLVEESNQVKITENEFASNPGSGLTLETMWPSTIVWLQAGYAEYNSVADNNFTLNSVGIHLGNVSRSNNVTTNNFTSNVDGVYISGNWFDGKHVISQNELYLNTDGVKIEGSIYNNVSKNEFTSNSVAVYVVDSTPQFYPFSGITNHIRNNSILNSAEGQTGIYLLSSERNLLQNNTINCTFNGVRDTDTWGVLLEMSESNFLTENKVDSNEHGIRLESSSDNNLTFNNMTNNFYNFGVTGTEIGHFPQEINTSNYVNNTPIYYWVGVNDSAIQGNAGYVGLVNSNNISVSNVSIKNNYQGILMANTSNSFFTNASVNWSYFGAYVKFSINNTINGNGSEWNSYFGHNRQGIYLYASSRNTIDNCTFKYNILRGIGIIGSVGLDSLWNNISYAKVTNGDWPSFGIYLEYAHYVKISNSSVFKHQYGIHIYGSSHDNVIEFTNVSENAYIGISFHTNSYDNYVYNNSICKNSWRGVRVWYGAHDITSFHNNFIDNKGDRQAEGQNTNNKWDDGYPSGGNYWDDYTGDDLFSGPNQDQPGSDGIGDTPYGIYNQPTVQKDHYPLMNLADAGPQ